MDKRYLSFEEQNELVKKSISGDESATVALINLCYPIAVKISKRYLLSDIDMEDLLQEAIHGILLAIPRFNPNKGAKFTTYCTFWMQKKMKQFAFDNIIHYPDAKTIELKKYSDFIHSFMVKYGREPTNKEIQDELDVSLEQILFYQSLPSSYFILDDIAAFIPSDDDVTDVAIIHVLLEEALDIVNESERKTLILRFGLYQNEPHTYKEISSILHCSQEWARHLAKTGILKMKKYFEKIGFDKTL